VILPYLVFPVLTCRNVVQGRRVGRVPVGGSEVNGDGAGLVSTLQNFYPLSVES
jgi:hypothetical protein